jgi:hypothetical protein
MAAGAFTLYSKAVLELTKGQINLSADTFVMALLTGSYVPAPNTDALWSDIAANELATGGGYTAGGLVLASETDTETAGVLTFTAASPSWASFSAGPFRYGVIVRRAGGALAGTDLLLCYSDLTGGGTVTGSGGAYTVTISGSGVFQVTHTP